MNIQVKDIAACMDAWAPPGWAYPWDRVGLQIGRPDHKVERALVCLTVTPEAVAKAKRCGASMIVAHHPLIWEPLKTLRTDDPHTGLCLELSRQDIACFAAHTNLDVAPGGVNAALAERLGLVNPRVLFPEDHIQQVKLVTFVPEDHQESLLDALADAGAGVIGAYTHCSFNAPGIGTFLPGATTNPFSGRKGVVNKEAELRVEMLVDKARLKSVLTALYAAHPYEEPAYDIVSLENKNEHVGLGMEGTLPNKMRLPDFAEFVREMLRLPFVRVYGAGNKHIARVAVLGGSGGGYIARLPGTVDAYISGDIDYHDAETARMRGIACIDAGHAGTELPVVDAIAARLRHVFPALKVSVYKEKESAAILMAPPPVDASGRGKRG